MQFHAYVYPHHLFVKPEFPRLKSMDMHFVKNNGINCTINACEASINQLTLSDKYTRHLDTRFTDGSSTLYSIVPELHYN